MNSGIGEPMSLIDRYLPTASEASKDTTTLMLALEAITGFCLHLQTVGLCCI
jgi:hypothetical protein